MNTVDKYREQCHELFLQKHNLILWHYTSVDAAIKIIESSHVRLGCYAFMNDPGEGLRSSKLVTDSWCAAIDEIQSHPTLDLKYLRNTDDIFSKLYDYKSHDGQAFLFSMSTIRDSLSQWARYSTNGAGIALGFKVDPSAFTHFCPHQQWSYGPVLYKVLYDWDTSDNSHSEQSQSTEDIEGFRRSLTDLFRSFILEAKNPGEIENGLYLIAYDLKPVIKQAAYHEEQEWRIVAFTVSESTSLYEIQPNSYGVVPFMKLGFGNGIQLEEIMLGPKLSKENHWSVEWLCRKNGIGAKITQSSFSYR
jgi:hypothetical protein